MAFEKSWCSPPDALGSVVMLPVLPLVALDAAGNFGPTALLTWTVDSLVPMTIWPAFTDDDAFAQSANPAPEFVFVCSRTGCKFWYSFDNSSVAAVGTGVGALSSSTSSNASALSAGIDTLVTYNFSRFSGPVDVTFNVTAVVNGSAVTITPHGNVTVQVRVDGAAAWLDIRNLTFSPATGTSFLHSVEPL